MYPKHTNDNNLAIDIIVFQVKSEVIRNFEIGYIIANL